MSLHKSVIRNRSGPVQGTLRSTRFYKLLYRQNKLIAIQDLNNNVSQGNMWYTVKLVMRPDSKEKVAGGSCSHLRGLMEINFDFVH